MKGKKAFSREYLFNYDRCDITDSVADAVSRLKEGGWPDQSYDLSVVIPDRNEDREALRYTVDRLARSNVYMKTVHGVERDKFRVSRIMLADQSDPEIADENEAVLREVSESLIDDLSPFREYLPDILHLRYDWRMSLLAYRYLRDYLSIHPDDQLTPLLGKGFNMSISSIALPGKDNGEVVLFFDAENAQVNEKDPFMLGSPLVYEGTPVLFNKSAFKRYHFDRNRKVLGGRVNASLGVPFINLLNYRNIIPEDIPIIYPFTGEIGMSQRLMNSIKRARTYGVETTDLLLSLADTNGSPLISKENFIQTHLGKNMDEPLGKGKSAKEVLDKVYGMCSDIMPSATHVIGDRMIKEWPDVEELLKEFSEFQRMSIYRWMESHDNREITGGVTPEDLISASFRAFSESVRALYEGRTIAGKDAFLPSINYIRDDMKEAFYEFRESLRELVKPIFSP